MNKIIALPVLLSALTIATFADISVSAPTNGATVQSPVNFVANASSNRTITGMVVYVDSRQVYSTKAGSLNTNIAMSNGPHAVVVKAWNSDGKIYSDWMTLQVTAPVGNGSGHLSVSTTSMPGAIAGTSYSTGLAATGGTSPYHWSVTSGQLPTGLTLSASGSIKGTPAASGSFAFTVDVKDSEATSQSASWSESISVAAAPALAITSASSLAGAKVGSPYSATLTAKGGLPPYSWSLASGVLPTGVKLSSAGLISGTPSAAGGFNFTARANDSASAPKSAVQNEGIIVTAASAASAKVTPPSQAAGYNLMFSDDFTSLDMSPNREGAYKWYEGIWWNSNVSPTSDINASNSTLNLNWVKGHGTGSTDVSACSKSGSNCHAFRYGYFEASMKWDPTTGSWPAFWLIPVEDITGADVINGVRESGEIDVFEGQGTDRTFYGTIHHWKNNVDIFNNNSSNAHQFAGSVDLTQYHTYGVLWVPGTISWYLDNKLISSAKTDGIFDQQNFYPVLSSQEGINWAGGDMTGVTAGTIPLNVAWVNVFQK